MTERTLSPDHAPLNHVEIVITRASHHNQQISQQFRDLGAEVILAPTIKFVDPPPSGDSRYDRGSWMIPERDVMKNPKTDSNKISLPGVLRVKREKDGQLHVYNRKKGDSCSINKLWSS